MGEEPAADPDELTSRDPDLDLDALERGHMLALHLYQDSYRAGRMDLAAAWEAVLVASGYGWPSTPRVPEVECPA